MQSTGKIKKIGVYTASALVIANMIGTGVFTSLGFQVESIQSGFVLIMLWLVGGIVALSGALSYSELGAALPRSGGEYNFLSKIYHPLIGFLSGWVSITVGFAAPTALAAMALASYSTSVFPKLNPILLATIVVFFLTLAHSKDIKTGSKLQNIFTSIKLILILFFIIAGCFISNPQPLKFFPLHGDWKLLTSSSFAVSLIYVSYAYSGWNAATYITGEIKEPHKNIPRALIMGTLVVVILYVFLNFIFLYTSPISELSGQVEIGYISAVNIFGNIGGTIMSLAISLLLVSTISAMIWVGPRVTQIMGEDHKILRFLAYKSPRGVPIYAMWLQTAIALTLIYTSTFKQVLLYAGFTLNLFTFLTVAGVFIFRIKQPKINRPYKTWGYPITPLLFLLLSLWILTYLLIYQPKESLAGLITVFAGVIFYLIDKFIVSNK